MKMRNYHTPLKRNSFVGEIQLAMTARPHMYTSPLESGVYNVLIQMGRYLQSRKLPFTLHAGMTDGSFYVLIDIEGSLFPNAVSLYTKNSQMWDAHFSHEVINTEGISFSSWLRPMCVYASSYNLTVYEEFSGGKLIQKLCHNGQGIFTEESCEDDANPTSCHTTIGWFPSPAIYPDEAAPLVLYKRTNPVSWLPPIFCAPDPDTLGLDLSYKRGDGFVHVEQPASFYLNDNHLTRADNLPLYERICKVEHDVLKGIETYFNQK